MGGCDAGVHVGCAHRFSKFLIAHVIDVLAGEGGGGIKTQGGCYAAGGHRVIAGDHDCADTGMVSLFDGLFRLVARWIDNADDTQEGQVIFFQRHQTRAPRDPQCAVTLPR